MRALLPLAAALLLGCADKSDSGFSGGDVGCAGFPDAPSPPDGVLESADSCGWWLLEVGDHLYVNVSLSVAEATCGDALGEGLILNAAPTYSNFDPDGPKWTYDVVGEAATTEAAVEITCDDGASWSALVDVN